MSDRNYKSPGKKMKMTTENAFVKAAEEFSRGYEGHPGDRSRECRLNNRQAKKLFTSGKSVRKMGVNERAAFSSYQQSLEDAAYAGYY